MDETSQIKKNFVYNVAYQVLLLILPLITVPYVSRILGADGIGTYSFTYSIVYYFALIALLGNNNYGNRAVSKVRKDKQKLSETFWGIYTIQLIMSLLMTGLYIAYIVIFSPEFTNIASLQIIHILAAMFDINWFFFGLEEFKLTVTRNIIIRLLSLIAIFLFVKTPDDVWIYTIIIAGSTLLTQVVLWPFLMKRITFCKARMKDIVYHLRRSLVLFVPVIAVSLYKVMDKIMLGVMTNVDEVGYYEQAEKLVNMPLAVVTALGTVMMPRMSHLIAYGHDEEMKEYIKKSVKFMMFLACPICFGLIAIADNFVPIFMGSGFDQSIMLVKLLSVTVLFLAFANTIRTGYLIPKEMDGVYVRLTIVGAVVNLVINLLLIPHLQSVGACIGTIMAELAVTIYQVAAVRKVLPVKVYFRDSFIFLIKSLVMFGLLMAVLFLGLSPVFTVLLQIAVGVSVYMLMNQKYIVNIIDFRKILRRKE